LKEIAMKTFMIATILSVGVLLRPDVAPPSGKMQDHNQIAAIGTTTQTQQTGNSLSVVEMRGAQGSGLFQCTTVLDASGDVYQSCCLNLWLFRICAEVNWSAITRLLPF
jgi:hypothetical protein